MSTKTAEVIKPESLPVNIDNKVQYVKRPDYTKVVAQQTAISSGTQVTREHVKQMLEALDGGQTELQGENPEVFVKLWEKVKADYSQAIKRIEEMREESARKKAEKEAEVAQKKEDEEKLFLAVKDTSSDFQNLAKQFDTGNMDRFIAKEGTSDAELFSAFNASLQMGEFTNWMKGDLVNEIVKRGHENVITKIAADRGISYATLHKAAKTAQEFPPDKRAAGVSYTIYAEVALAKFPENKAKEVAALVDKVSEGKFNTQTVREQVKAIQGKTPPAVLLPEEDPKSSFIVVDKDADGNARAEIATGFPRELFESGATVINPKTLKRFTGFGKKAENRWAELGAYVKPVATEAAPKKKGAKK